MTPAGAARRRGTGSSGRFPPLTANAGTTGLALPVTDGVRPPDESVALLNVMAPAGGERALRGVGYGPSRVISAQHGAVCPSAKVAT
jgi:hypothetical protein